MLDHPLSDGRFQVVIFIDLVQSTMVMKGGPSRETMARLTARLAGIEAEFRTVDPSLRRLGAYAGDGMIVTGQNPAALVRAALRAQVSGNGLVARIALGLVQGEWYAKDSPHDETFYGLGVNEVARLMAFCPPGAVVLANSFDPVLTDTPDLRAKFWTASATLVGLGRRRYWVSELMASREWQRGAWMREITVAAGVVILVLGAGWFHQYAQSAEHEKLAESITKLNLTLAELKTTIEVSNYLSVLTVLPPSERLRVVPPPGLFARVPQEVWERAVRPLPPERRP